MNQNKTEFLSFTSGVCRIEGTNGEKVYPKICFLDKTVTLERIFNLRPSEGRIDRIISIPMIPCINVKDFVIIGEEIYEINAARPIRVSKPPSLELTLQKLERWAEHE